MKQRITTPVSKQRFTKFTVVFLATLMILAAPLASMPRVNADKFDSRIAAVKREIDAYNKQARKFQGQADTLQNKVDVLQNQQNKLQAEIDLQQAQYDKLQEDIKKTEKEIEDNKLGLGEVIASLYVDDEISPLEMLASSKNIGDYVDKQEYRSSIRDQLNDTIKTIQDLKAKLEDQRQQVKLTLDNQNRTKQELVAKKQEQQKLLSETRGKESAYRSLQKKSESELRKLEEQQRAALASIGGGSFLPGDPNKGGYPWGGNGCYVAPNLYSYGGVNGDGTDPLGYACRQCTSYAAWKVYQKTGRGYRGMGNAKQWPFTSGVNNGSQPRAKSVGVSTAGPYGHVVWVESVNGDGTINISQYNYYNAGGSGWGHYSEMRVSASTYNYYIYF